MEDGREAIDWKEVEGMGKNHKILMFFIPYRENLRLSFASQGEVKTFVHFSAHG